MDYLKGVEIDSALSEYYRNYLTGRLERPQPFLNCIDDDIEIGISWYEKFTADAPHVHPTATEHVLVLKGCIRCRILGETNKDYEFSEGDFFVLRPGEVHATKNAERTKVLFIKSPGTNDKQVVEVDKDTKEWLKSWD